MWLFDSLDGKGSFKDQPTKQPPFQSNPKSCDAAICPIAHNNTITEIINFTNTNKIAVVAGTVAVEGAVVLGLALTTLFDVDLHQKGHNSHN